MNPPEPLGVITISGSLGLDDGSLLTPVTFKEPGTSPDRGSVVVTVATCSSLWFGGQREHPVVGVLQNSHSRWCVSDPLPPSAALPLTSTSSWRGQRNNSEELVWDQTEPCAGLRIEHGNGKCRSYPHWCWLRRARSRV